MKSRESRYLDIDVIRLLSCFAVFLYHLNLLKGGYLAVCVFFVLSGYLACVSAFRKEKFSIWNYYSNKLLKLYFPLVLVIFITISIVTFFPNIHWLNLKPETTSVLLGYNNFWQLNVNLDYFARHINSPFMHFWYIAILLQFDLIFPFIYLVFRKIGDRIHKIIPCLFCLVLSILFAGYFFYSSLNQDMMVSYYHTVARSFSLLFGVTLGFIHCYYKNFVLDLFQIKSFYKIIFWSYVIFLFCFFVFVDAKSKYYAISMIVVSFIACRLIDYGTIYLKNPISLFDRVITFLAGISYEVYLVQYPIIFLFQFVNFSTWFKIFLIFVFVILVSFLLHYFVNSISLKKRLLFSQFILSILILGFSFDGIHQYYLSKDHTVEMNLLEKQLARNEELTLEHQKEYSMKLQQEEKDWESTLSDLENTEKDLEEVIHHLSVIGIGDSIMLGAVDRLYQVFPNGYFDAQTSRTAWMVGDIVKKLKMQGLLKDVVIFNLGSNGDCSLSCKIDILDECSDQEVFWVNVVNDSDVHVNDSLLSLVSRYDNFHVIDWNSVSKNHLDYFVADGIHLTDKGKEIYSQTIYNAIYQVYLKEFELKREEVMKRHQESIRNKISFFGNDILLNAYDEIHSDFGDAQFYIHKDFNYEMLKKEIMTAIDEDSLSHKIVFLFDDTFVLDLDEYKNLIYLCAGHEIYFVSSFRNVFDFSDFGNVTVVDFFREIEKNDAYLMADGIHLTNQGNQALNRLLKQVIS